MQQIIIDEETEGQRLNKLLGKYLDAAPQSFLYKMFRKKNIKYNHKRATGNEIVHKGDVVDIFMSDDTIKNFQKGGTLHGDSNALADVQILFENEDVLIINKPAGMLSQKAEAGDYSLNERIVDYYHSRENYSTIFTPSVCNRLDRNTSGIILAGMSLKGTRELSHMLKERELDKYYLTIVYGIVCKSETIKGFLAKKQNHNQVVIYKSLDEAGKNGEDHPAFIETRYEPIVTGKFRDMHFSLLKVKLITGKTHQIRAHLDSIGHPVIGDGKYGMKSVNAVMKREFGLKNQLLHAYNLTFPEKNCGLEELSGKHIYAGLPEAFYEIGVKLFGKEGLEKFIIQGEEA